MQVVKIAGKDGDQVSETSNALDVNIKSGAPETMPLPTGAATEATLDGIKTAVEGATPAGENHIGSIGGHTEVVVQTPTITVGSYSVGYLIGGLMTIANAARTAAGKGTIQGVVITDKAKQDAAINVCFFKTNLSNSTLTEHAALTVHDTDLLEFIGAIKVISSDYVDFADNSAATKSSQGLPFQCSAGSTAIYAIAVAAGSATYASTSDLQFKFKIWPD